ncbi:MAG TPA: hypothetical protein PL091_15920, partial [Actinomycetota bacterium]|nr:hypothetical protein [Actinomycetota bacterium]
MPIRDAGQHEDDCPCGVRHGPLSLHTLRRPEEGDEGIMSGMEILSICLALALAVSIAIIVVYR